MQIRLNDEIITCQEALRLDELIVQYQLSERSIAIARNQQLIPRHSWSETVLSDGDHIVVFQAIAGG